MKLRDLSVGVSAFSGATPVDWVMFSSGVSAIAQADVTKHAKEIPIVRRIGIASILLAEHPLAVRSKSHCPMPIISDGRECRSV